MLPSNIAAERLNGNRNACRCIEGVLAAPSVHVSAGLVAEAFNLKWGDLFVKSAMRLTGLLNTETWYGGLFTAAEPMHQVTPLVDARPLRFAVAFVAAMSTSAKKEAVSYWKHIDRSHCDESFLSDGFPRIDKADRLYVQYIAARDAVDDAVESELSVSHPLFLRRHRPSLFVVPDPLPT